MIWPFCRHRFDLLGITDVEEISFGTPGPVHTEVRLLCLKCGHVKTKKFKRRISVQQISRWLAVAYQVDIDIER